MTSLRSFTAALLLAATLVACGGGGGGSTGGAATGSATGAGAGAGSTCASVDTFIGFSYPRPLEGNVGTLLSSVPEVAGVPSSCSAGVRFTLAAGAIPPGLALDATTGVVSGTPTASGTYFFEVRMTVTELGRSRTTGISAKFNNPAVQTFSGWELMTELAPFLNDFRLGALGGKLYVVSRGFYTHVVETYESADGGATWSLLPVPGPAGDLRGFALASDGLHIYLSGGSDGTVQNSAVWRFDGNAWTQMNSAAAFPAREGHAMLVHGGALYVLGGLVGNSDADDTWRSTDAGVSWTRTSSSGFLPRRDFCAVSDGAGFLYALGGNRSRWIMPAGALATDAVFRSADGVTWTPVPVATSSPLMAALYTGSGSCAELGGRIVYVGSSVELAGSSSTVSTTDGTTWIFEPHRIGLVDLSPGAVTLGGRVYVTAGSGTSQRRVLRTTP